jgi:hypothetical protein
MEVRDDRIRNDCSTPGYFLKPVFLSGTVPCNATYLPTAELSPFRLSLARTP